MLKSFFSQIPNDILKSVERLDFALDSSLGSHEIDQLLNKTVLAGGKRVRPLLTLLFARHLGEDWRYCLDLARAIEMVHAASLAHDDVIDHASTRRTLPTLNALAGNQKAVLAGDYLLSHMIVLVSKQGKMPLVQEVASVIEQLSIGEWMQLDAATNRNYSAEIIQQIAIYKTSSVMSFAALAPAIQFGYSDELVEKMRLFGRHLGIAFQQIDDVIDFNSQGQKQQNIDLQNGLVNSVIYQCLSDQADLWRRFKAGESLIELFKEVSPELLDHSLIKIKKEAKAHLDVCGSILDQLEDWQYDRLKNRDLKSTRAALDFILKMLADRMI